MKLVLFLRVMQLVATIGAFFVVIQGKEPILFVMTFLYIDLRVAILLLELKADSNK
jgi:hypothetical protein